MITCGVLLIGRFFYKGPYTAKEWGICVITNIINTIITYVGFWLWKHGIIKIAMGISWGILLDFFCSLWLWTCDVCFSYRYSQTFLYKAVHHLHHEAVDPKPIDLFVLHPVETFGFGSLWLLLLIVYPFNIYAIVIYLTINVIFGLAGHLGIEPLPERILRMPLIKYLGTSTFHHNHHQDIQHNFGFYTSIWDRLFKTYK
ncbi:sterol desaturase family protein [Chitinophaga pinensis]|uniref:Sterol desaturase family protein n=1 Tax=Chitinophaga pinensis TaxID=79329 RepID=A0A5C6LRU3_9BACT|nr:sterol desaturase family protein [Chitinophaga pinensis]TWV97437.1 sterol desaturase family protein [Chitinophaga pinensis]